MTSIETKELIKLSVTLSPEGIQELQERIQFQVVGNEYRWTGRRIIVKEEDLLKVRDGFEPDPTHIRYYLYTYESLLKFAQFVIYNAVSERYQKIQHIAQEIRKGFEKHGFSCDQCGCDSFGERHGVTDENWNPQPGIDICSNCFSDNLGLDAEDLIKNNS